MNDVNLEGLLRRHQQGWGLEQSFYTQQEIFDFEWEVIWKEYWLFVVRLRCLHLARYDW